jgi:putative hydrolase
MTMIDLHTHTFLSDGVLAPAELVSRAEEAGYKAIGIADHVDYSNLDRVISGLLEFCHHTQKYYRGIKIIPAVEITHVPPAQIGKIVADARRLGARLVVCHGETICEPVYPGTNQAAIEAKVDILAHPGLITPSEVKLAQKNKVYLEITSRYSHGLANGRVARLALEQGAELVLNSDLHAPEDLHSPLLREKIAMGAGLSPEDLARINQNMQDIVEAIFNPRITA